jgi:hypothetical protein
MVDPSSVLYLKLLEVLGDEPAVLDEDWQPANNTRPAATAQGNFMMALRVHEPKVR